MLNQAVREALEAEMEHLQAERNRVIEHFDAKIAALKAILDPEDGLGMFQPQSPTTGGDPQEPASSSSHPGNGSLAGKGLREAMRSVLAMYPSGLRPIDLAVELEKRGYRPGGKTPTKTLVYGEIFRLFSDGKLAKQGKRYKLPADRKLEHGLTG